MEAEGGIRIIGMAVRRGGRHNSAPMSYSLNPQKLTLIRRIPMPLLSILIGLICGLVVWGLLEQVQPGAVRSIFSMELESRRQQQARETLIRFDNYVLTHISTARLLANHRVLASYLEPIYWLDDEPVDPQNHFQTPTWLPPAPLWHDWVRPSQVLLADEGGKVREIFHVDGRSIPSSLSRRVDLLLEGRQIQAKYIVLNTKPYLVISEDVADVTDSHMGSLILVVPIDQQFLTASQQGISSGDVVVGLLDPSGEHILATSDQDAIPEGTMRESMEQGYLVTEQMLSGHGATSIQLKFVTLIPLSVKSRIQQRVMALEYRQRIVAVLIFVCVFTSVFFLLSQWLNQILQRIARFSQRALGAKQPVLEKGNQLFALEDWVQQFIQLVRDTRDEMRQQHETEMLESEALKQVLMETALDSIITIDELGRIIEFNNTAQTIFAYERDHVIGQDFVSLLLEKSARPVFLRLFCDLLKGVGDKGGVRHDMLAIRGDGECFPIELAVKPIELHERVALTVYIHDVSNRKRAEEEIRELARFTSESPNPVLRVSRRGVILYANSASDYLLEYWGCEQAQTLPQYWRTRVLHILERNQYWETQLICDTKTYSLIFSPVADADYVNIYGRDVSAVKEAERVAREHQQELVHVCRLSTMGEMATGLAHELNQPLSAIANYASGSTRRLRLQEGAPQDIISALDQISHQADRAGEIIRRLRGLVAKQAPVRAVVDTNDLVQEVCSFIEFEAKKEGLVIDQDLSLEPLPVKVDIVQIEQVMLNLLRNALDALLEIPEDKRQLAIKSRSVDSSVVEISVIDSGKGISREVIGHLFEPFFTTKQSGMGVGLVISKTIMEDHKGSISVENSEGGGACFVMRLPREDKNE